MIYDNGDIYRGEMKEDRRQGYGYYIYNSGTVYLGEWDRGQ